MLIEKKWRWWGRNVHKMRYTMAFLLRREKTLRGGNDI